MSHFIVIHNAATRLSGIFKQAGQLTVADGVTLAIALGEVTFTGGPGNLAGGTPGAIYNAGSVQFTGGPGQLSATAELVVHVYGEASEVTVTTAAGAVDTEPLPYWEDPTITTPPQVAFDSYSGDTYRYFVFDILTDRLLGELNMGDVQFSLKLGAVGDFTGTIHTGAVRQEVDLYPATAPGRTALYVLRDERPVWGGIIWDRSYSANTRTLTVNAATWESYLFKRFVWHTYTTPKDADQYQVVRQFFRHMRRDFNNLYVAEDNVTPISESITQAIDLYTTDIPWEHGHAQDEITYKRENMKSFGEMLTDFADNVNGFEWYFVYTYNGIMQRFRRRLHFLPTPPHLLPKGSPKPQDNETDKPGIDTFLFEFPGNIVTLDLEEDAQNACTRQFVVGGYDPSLNTEKKPIGSWNNMGAINAGYPLFENVESSRHNDVAKLGRLNRLAAIYGRQSAPPIRNWNVTVAGDKDPIVGSYRVGHWCRVMIHDPFIQQSLDSANVSYANGIVKRIMGYTVNVPTGSQLPELVTLELEDDFFIPNEPAGPNDDL